jgi:hypothetical protein
MAGGEEHMKPKEIFDRINTRLVTRRQDMLLMALTGYSFEEWINWEAFLACREASDGSRVDPKPGYRATDLADTGEAADLLVGAVEGPKVVVEVALVHDETLDKWKDKIDYDQEKLSRVPKSKAATLQLVIAVSTKGSIVGNPVWETWFAKTRRFAATRPTFQSTTPIPEGGQYVIFGWI